MAAVFQQLTALELGGYEPVLEEMVERFPPGSIRLAPDFDWVCVDHMLEYGPEHLQVVVGD